MGMRMYDVDMRLRPSGRQGLLVSSLAGFRRYHERPLAIWERLALLRLRAVTSIDVGPDLVAPRPDSSPEPEPAAGARMASGWTGPLFEAVDEVVRASLMRPLSDPTGGVPRDPRGVVAGEVRRLKQRIEAELARETRKRFNAKTGYGGSLELELLVAALQLQLAGDHPEVLVRGIVDAIAALQRIGALRENEAGALRAAYVFLRRLLNRLRMTQQAHGRLDDPDRFAQNSPRLVTLARRMGLPSREALIDQFLQTREVVRNAFDRHLAP
jgi:glutamate-ammonia-ligase adenylyltransferase